MSARAITLLGDVREQLRALRASSVHCVVTSPPYWALRDYSECGCVTQRNAGPADYVTGQITPGDPRCSRLPDPNCAYCAGRGRIEEVRAHQIGLEATPELYIRNMVEVFREVRRVLRPDGTVWMNMGDASAQGNKGQSGDVHTFGAKQLTNRGSHATRRGESIGPNRTGGANELCKPKDILGLPWMLAFALRADGWWLRMDIIWSKPNPMPESCKDRPTRAHEYLFLLSRSARYFYDHIAVQEPAQRDSVARGMREGPGAMRGQGQVRADQHSNRANRSGRDMRGLGRQPMRNRRSVWGLPQSGRSIWHIAPRAFRGAHFATFPPDLVKPCILAGTSEHGCCAECGAPWQRLTAKVRNCESAELPANQQYPAEALRDGNRRRKASESEGGGPSGWRQSGSGRHAPGDARPLSRADREYAGKHSASHPQSAIAMPAQLIGTRLIRRTSRWAGCPTCHCSSERAPIPATVLDPFAGAGTVALVAKRLGRSSVSIELKQEYADMAERRLALEGQKANGKRQKALEAHA